MVKMYIGSELSFKTVGPSGLAVISLQKADSLLIFE
jgi:hypothetical protein